MQLVRHELETKENNAINLYAFGDLHIASIAFQKDAFLKLVQEIKENDGYWIGMGDFGEAIPVTDRRFDPDSIREEYRNELPRYHQLEVRELKEMLEPIKNRCLGILEGNHEVSLKTVQFDMMWELCNHFHWPNLTAEAFIRLVLRKGTALFHGTLNCDIFCAHGYGASRTKGGSMAKLQRLMDHFLADLLLIGHTHIAQPLIDAKIRLPKTKSLAKKLYIDKKIRLGFFVPSFYLTYKDGIDTYASRMLYAPSIIGAWRATIRWMHPNCADKLVIESPITNLEG